MYDYGILIAIEGHIKELGVTRGTEGHKAVFMIARVESKVTKWWFTIIITQQLNMHLLGFTSENLGFEAHAWKVQMIKIKIL